MTSYSGPAFPTLEKIYMGDGRYEENTTWGLTKREYYAAHALQGLCASCTTIREKDWIGQGTAEHYAELAVRAADALLKRLEIKDGSPR